MLCLGRRPGPLGRHLPWDAAVEAPDRGALADCDLVIHCAAAVGDHPPGSPAEAEQLAVNVTGTARLLESATARPLVMVSSASVYDPRPSRALVTEDHPTASGHLNAYGRSKAAGERLALAAGAVVLRPRAVYGEGDPHLVPRLLARLGPGGLLPLPGPDVLLSLTSVQNLADACLAAAGWPPGAYNVADAEPYLRDEALRRVCAALGRRPRIVHLPRPLVRLAARTRRTELTGYAVDQLATSVVLDTTRARAQGWRPTHDLSHYLARIAIREAVADDQAAVASARAGRVCS
ncbi:NAD(P)-dependent oxidoreductase [Kitasatospora viridis]